MITNELILKLLTKMNGEILKPMKYEGNHEPYEWEVFHQDKPPMCCFSDSMTIIPMDFELEIK